MKSPLPLPRPLRSIPVVLAATAAVALAGCSSDDPAGSAGPSPETAKTTVERAAGLQLTAVAVPAEAREQGLSASYTNSATAARDKQVVGVFVMKDAGVVDEVADMVRSSAPDSARLIRNGKVMVVYAAAGSDRGAAVQRAVKGL